jgi:hypothetical protein
MLADGDKFISISLSVSSGVIAVVKRIIHYIIIIITHMVLINYNNIY